VSECPNADEKSICSQSGILSGDFLTLAGSNVTAFRGESAYQTQYFDVSAETRKWWEISMRRSRDPIFSGRLKNLKFLGDSDRWFLWEQWWLRAVRLEEFTSGCG